MGTTEPIIVDYRWSLDDYLASFRYHYRQMVRPVLLSIGNGLVWFLFLAMLLANGIECYNGKFKPDLLFPTCFIGLVLAYPYLARYSLKRQYLKRPDRDVDIQWEISDDKLLVRVPASINEFSWNYVVRAVVTPQAIMFYPCIDRIWYYLPRRGFKNDDFEQLVQLAQSKVKNFRHVK